MKKLMKKLIGKKMTLVDLIEKMNAGNCGLEYFFEIGFEVFNRPEGIYTEVLAGSVSNDEWDIWFETTGKWEVIENKYSNIYKTVIDKNSVNVVITDVSEIIS